MLPNAMIIGATKCGTTSAYFNLSQHPKVVFLNEPRFFDRHWERGVDWYERRFQHLDPNELSIIGDKTPSLYADKQALSRIKSIMPNIKMILLLRNPVHRLISRWRHRLKRRDPMAKIEEVIEMILYQDDYSESIQQIWDMFSKEQLHIAISERVRINMDVEYGRMFSFLGVEPFNSTYELQNITQNRVPVPPVVLSTIFDKYREANERLFETLGYDIPEWSEMSISVL